MGDDSSISDRVQSYSEVNKEQLCDKESVTAVEEETCRDPSPSVSSGGVSGTSGMNYPVGTEGLRRSEEMVRAVHSLRMVAKAVKIEIMQKGDLKVKLV